MAYYYYDRYNTVSNKVYVHGDWVSNGTQEGGGDNRHYPGYTFDTATGLYKVTGIMGTISNLGTAYDGSGTGATTILRYTKSGSYNYSKHTAKAATYSLVTSKGTLAASNVILDDATYPANGALGSNWFIKKTAIKAPSLNGKFTSTFSPQSGGNSIKLTWSTGTDPQSIALKYIIKRKKDSETTWTNVVSSTTALSIDTILPKEPGTYTYSLETTNGYITHATISYLEVIVGRNYFLFKADDSFYGVDEENGLIELTDLSLDTIKNYAISNSDDVKMDSIKGINSSSLKVICITDQVSGTIKRSSVFEVTKKYDSILVNYNIKGKRLKKITVDCNDAAKIAFRVDDKLLGSTGWIQENQIQEMGLSLNQLNDEPFLVNLLKEFSVEAFQILIHVSLKSNVELLNLKSIQLSYNNNNQTPTVTNIELKYSLENEEKPQITAILIDGREIPLIENELTPIGEEIKSLKVSLKGDQEIHAISYSWK